MASKSHLWKTKLGKGPEFGVKALQDALGRKLIAFDYGVRTGLGRPDEEYLRLQFEGGVLQVDIDITGKKSAGEYESVEFYMDFKKGQRLVRVPPIGKTPSPR